VRRTNVKIHAIKKASASEAEAFTAAAKEFEAEINNPDFWWEVSKKYNNWSHQKLLAPYNYEKQPFASFKEMVMTGVDDFNAVLDYSIDINVEFYYSWRSVVGYTKPSTWFTWINRNMFNGFNLHDIAGNQAHEYLHNCGLDHPGTDRNSVVYQFGYLMRERIKARLGRLDKPVKYKRSFWTRVKSVFKRIF